ncbi:hypothetical protein J6590_082703 [Homalodisca vitripennis]|nr:hypothetical protein J6590_082703 [Homalodisca vitripennis]
MICETTGCPCGAALIRVSSFCTTCSKKELCACLLKGRIYRTGKDGGRDCFLSRYRE